MLELVHVEVALRRCRILARVVLEVLDLHVHALLLGLLGELHPLRIGAPTTPITTGLFLEPFGESSFLFTARMPKTMASTIATTTTTAMTMLRVVWLTRTGSSGVFGAVGCVLFEVIALSSVVPLLLFSV